MNSKNVIEINGKFYDTVSGQLVVEPFGATAPATAPAPQQSNHDNHVVSHTTATSVHTRQTIAKPAAQAASRPVRPSTAQSAVPAPQQPATETYHATRTTNHAHQIHQKVQVHSATEKTHVKPSAATHIKVQTSTHATGTHHTPHKQQTSSTLMRHAVTKPKPGLKKQLHAQTALAGKTPNLLVKKTSAYSVTPERVVRAQATPKSQQVSRFEQRTTSFSIPVALAPVPVMPAPDEQPEGGVPTTAGAPNPAPTNKPADMFEHAIQNANHFVDTKVHTRAFRKKRHQQVLSIAAASLALVVIAGFATYMNSPGLQFKLASVQAGLGTQAPDFAAAGFAYGGVRTERGTLTVGLKNGDSTLQLSQQNTNWSDTDLLREAKVGTDASGQPLYKTIDADGTTVYRFNDTSATWIKNGVWYQLSSPEPITSSQIRAVAQNS